jgi:hypothetical protein
MWGKKTNPSDYSQTKTNLFVLTGGRRERRAAQPISNLQSLLQKATKPFRQAQGPEPVEGETKGAEKNDASFPLLPSVQIPWFEGT